MASDRTLSLYLQLVRRTNMPSYRAPNPGTMRMIGATTEPPTKREKDSVVVKIRVIVPDEAFDPSRYPTAEVRVPLSVLSPASDVVVGEAEDVED